MQNSSANNTMQITSTTFKNCVVCVESKLYTFLKEMTSPIAMFLLIKQA